MRTVDLSGQRFGKLTVIEKTGERSSCGAVLWTCVCDCGNRCLKPANALKGGLAVSCGCAWRESHVKTKQRFGRLTAVKRTGEISRGRSAIWECKCDCGQMLTVEARNLVSGRTKSCGCFMRDSNRDKLKTVLTYTEDTCIEFLEGISKPRKGTSPETNVRGVRMVNGKYEARITFRKKTYILGRYFRLDDAIAARRDAEEEIQTHLDNLKYRNIPLPDELFAKKSGDRRRSSASNEQLDAVI